LLTKHCALQQQICTDVRSPASQALRTATADMHRYAQPSQPSTAYCNSRYAQLTWPSVAIPEVCSPASQALHTATADEHSPASQALPNATTDVCIASGQALLTATADMRSPTGQALHCFTTHTIYI